MGRLNAEAMAEAVQEGLLSLDGALVYHLQSNHYPPLPRELAATAKQAIQFVQEGRAYEIVLQAESTGGQDIELTAAQAVEWLHLGPFIQEDSDD